ncbi:MAG: type 2 periplasmic-binding domain-containing protein, partial [Caulobacteraceae bacterium]
VMPRMRSLLVAILLAALTPALVLASPSRRQLHVSLYPYIPDAAAAALSLKQGFERLHPDVVVDIDLNANYYSLKPTDKGVLYENADVHEIDVVFLDDFIARRKLAPLSPRFAASLGKFSPIALKAAASHRGLAAVPQWMCTNFLIYRGDATAPIDVQTLTGLERALPPQHGLLMNMTGADSLGELYLSALLARYGSSQAALDHVTDTPEPEMMARLKRLLALEPVGFGRDPDYAAREDFYARQFARGAGDAFVGYSELIHDALDETAASCRKEDHCVTASEIHVAPPPFEDHVVRPMVWIDAFGIDARAHGRTLTDAQDFIRYAVSLPAYRALLIPAAGAPPRYLLPATQAALSDPAILAAAPLYRDLIPIVDQGEAIRAPDLTARLHDVALKIDAELPPHH